MKRPIAISLSPNTQKEDVKEAIKLILFPSNYSEGNAVNSLEKWFQEYFDVKHTTAFASGRAALFAILKAMKVRENDEVILQAFTCVAVPNAVIWTGAKPIYCDITHSFSFNIKDLEKKINKNTKAIIVQHTFGIPNNIEEIIRIAKEKNIFVIEDCAHGIGVIKKNKKIGLFGDAAIFSFGRDKAFSSVFGGMAITNNVSLGEEINIYRETLSYPTKLWIFQQLFHPFAFFLILPFYNFFSLGKFLLVLFQKLFLLSFPVTPREKKSEKEDLFIKKMPNALAKLALTQLKKLNIYNKKREENANEYIEKLSNYFEFPKKSLPYLRFPVFTTQRDKLIDYLKQNGIYVGKWYSEIIDPKGVDFKKCSYNIGECPVAEEMAKKIVNLPTYPLMNKEDIQKVVNLLNIYAKNKSN